MFPQVLRFINFRFSPVLTFASKKNGACDIQRMSRSISSKATRALDTSIKKPDPWPYETKKYNFFRAHFDKTLKRFDENTAMIVVDGNIGCGKSLLAKTLADELDMKFFPEVSMDQIYIFDDGFDFRQLDHLLPKSLKCCDIRTFYENPHHHNLINFQLDMFRLRFEQYLDALAHLTNTGQGVVLERCVFSDFVFLEALVKFGYLNKAMRKYYYQCQENSMFDLFRPHLVVYLDVPSNVLLDRIKKRNIPYEVNSKVLTKDYLDTIEHFYKQNYIKQISEHSEVLVYDWSNYGDPEAVVDDIERIDFDKYDRYDIKLRAWRNEDDPWYWNNYRRYVTNNKLKIIQNTFYPSLEVPEIIAPASEIQEYKHILQEYVPQLKWAKGYNKSRDNYWFKMSHNYRELQKYKLPFT